MMKYDQKGHKEGHALENIPSQRFRYLRTFNNNVFSDESIDPHY